LGNGADASLRSHQLIHLKDAALSCLPTLETQVATENVASSPKTVGANCAGCWEAKQVVNLFNKDLRITKTCSENEKRFSIVLHSFTILSFFRHGSWSATSSYSAFPAEQVQVQRFPSQNYIACQCSFTRSCVSNDNDSHFTANDLLLRTGWMLCLEQLEAGQQVNGSCNRYVMENLEALAAWARMRILVRKHMLCVIWEKRPCATTNILSKQCRMYSIYTSMRVRVQPRPSCPSPRCACCDHKAVCLPANPGSVCDAWDWHKPWSILFPDSARPLVPMHRTCQLSKEGGRWALLRTTVMRRLHPCSSCLKPS